MARTTGKKGKGKKKGAGVDRAEMIRREKEKAKQRSTPIQSNTVKVPDGIGLYKAEEGRDVFSIVPFTDGWTYPFFIHRDVGPENTWVTCLRRTFNKPCPICEEVAKLKSEGADFDKQIRPLLPSQRALFLLIHDGELKMLDFSHHNFGKLLDVEIGDLEDDEERVFFIPEDGIDLRVRWVSEKIGKYTVISAASIKFVDRKEDLDDELVEKAAEVDLEGCITQMDYDKMQALFHHLDPDDVEDDDDEEEPDEPNEDEEEAEEPEDDEEEEDEPDEEEEDDEEEPDDDSEEEEDDDDEDDEEEEDDEDEEEEEEPPPPPKKKKGDKKGDKKSSGKSTSKKSSKAKKGECPSGHTFGEDCDQFPEDCDDCPVWEACFDAKEK